jgi:hypothetical protein
VVAPGGRVSFGEPDSTAGEELARSLRTAGFADVEVITVGEEALVSGRLG